MPCSWKAHDVLPSEWYNCQTDQKYFLTASRVYLKILIQSLGMFRCILVFKYHWCLSPPVKYFESFSLVSPLALWPEFTILSPEHWISALPVYPFCALESPSLAAAHRKSFQSRCITPNKNKYQFKIRPRPSRLPSTLSHLFDIAWLGCALGRS